MALTLFHALTVALNSTTSNIVIEVRKYTFLCTVNLILSCDRFMKEAMRKKHYLFLYEGLQKIYKNYCGVNTLWKKV